MKSHRPMPTMWNWILIMQSKFKTRRSHSNFIEKGKAHFLMMAATFTFPINDSLILFSLIFFFTFYFYFSLDIFDGIQWKKKGFYLFLSFASSSFYRSVYYPNKFYDLFLPPPTNKLAHFVCCAVTECWILRILSLITNVTRKYCHWNEGSFLLVVRNTCVCAWIFGSNV